MSVRLYQIGSQRSHWHDPWNDNRMAVALAGPDSPLRANDGNVQLILGIKASGVSHLLLTRDQLSALRNLPTFNSHSPDDFESLSPILFRTTEDLLTKLKQLRKDSKKRAVPVKNLPEFEQARTFYRVLTGAIESEQDLRQFNVLDNAWKYSVRVCAFAFNTDGLFREARNERIQRPNILDIGWAEASLPSFNKKEGNVHIKVARNKYIQISSKVEEKFDEDDGTTEYLENEDIKCRLEEFLAGHLSSTAKEPLILLVFDEQASRHALRYFGLDLSEWKSGIKDLLNGGKPPKYGRPHESRPSIHSTSTMSNHGQDDRKYRVKSRSRSPHEFKYSSKRQPSPPRERTYPPGYIIDLKTMYNVLMTGDYGADGLRSIATNLGFLDDGKDHRNIWCAGNEAGFAFDIWRSMISGPAFDAQLSEKLTIAQNLSTLAVHASSDVLGPSNPVGDKDDEDEDPNAFLGLQQSGSIRPSTAIPHKRVPYEPDSESDYESD